MPNDRILSLIGLATKGGKTASGEFMTENKVKARKAKMVIVATDASDNTKKEFRDMCSFYKVPYAEYGTKDELGHAMGKEMRASLAVTDEGFARSLAGLLKGSSTSANEKCNSDMKMSE